MTLGRSPSQRFRIQQPSWTTIPSGFSDINDAQNLLLQLIQIIDDAVNNLPHFDDRLKALQDAGKNVDFLIPKYKAYAAQAQKGLDWFADLIEKDPNVQSAIDNKAGTQTTPGLNDIKVGAWKEIVTELRKPQPVAGLGFLPALAEIAAVVGRALSNPAVWNGVKQVLVVAIPWIGSTAVSNNVAQIVNGSNDTKEKLEKCLAALEAADTADKKAQVERVCGAAQSSGSTWLWLLLGVGTGVGALIYLQSKGHTISVQSRSAALSGMPRKRRRRK